MKSQIPFILGCLLTLISCNSGESNEVTLAQNDSQVIITAPSEEIATHPDLYITAGSGLSLREGTNLKSKKILTIPYGSKVKHLSSPNHTSMNVDGITGTMLEVDYQGAKGFVFSGYVDTLSPPLKDEKPEDYAKRISTENLAVEVVKKPHPDGSKFGQSTAIKIPAQNWMQAYSICKVLFDLPKGIHVDLNKTYVSFIENSNKRHKTLKDEVEIVRNESSEIEKIQYNYALRSYTREVAITKDDDTFLLKEIETSL